jgi:hypothetical protein
MVASLRGREPRSRGTSVIEVTADLVIAVENSSAVICSYEL